MSEIEINKDELTKAISTFRSAIETYETAATSYLTAAAKIDGQSSNFINQMKVWLEYNADTGAKELIESLNTYVDAVQNVVDGFTASDEELSRSLQNGNRITNQMYPANALDNYRNDSPF